MALELYTGPTVEPLTLTEAKEHLRVDHIDDDSLIESLIKAARRSAEVFQGRSYLSQTWKLYLDTFPCEKYIYLPFPPLQSVTSISYIDGNGDVQTLATSRYQVDAKSQPGRVILEPGYAWPATETDRVNAVIITFVAGYGATSASVPENIRHAVRLILGDMYTQRENTIVGSSVNQIPQSAKILLWQDRNFNF
jgi:uncharacterized phiE125 gp8 family phage protein